MTTRAQRRQISQTSQISHERENDFIVSIGENYPLLARYLRGLTDRAGPGWQDYESAKAIVNWYSLEPREYEACMRFITDRLRL